MNLRYVILATAGWAIVGLPNHGTADGDTRPDIVLIMADDISPRWFSIYDEQQDVSTPNIDRLGNEGVCFRTAWATPMCSPTRALLMTGQYGMRTGWLHNDLKIPDSQGNTDFLKRGTKTFAHVLHGAGYRTAFLGRWGIPANWQMARRDYDEYFLQATSQYLLPKGATIARKQRFAKASNRALKDRYEAIVELEPGKYHGRTQAAFRIESESGYGYGPFLSRYWHPAIVSNDRLVPTRSEDFALDLYVDFTVDFLDRTRDVPSLVYLPLHLPHNSTVPVAKWVSKVPTTPLSGRPGTNFGGGMKEATAYLDIAVGNLVTELRDRGLLENTLLIFTGDNGDAFGPTGKRPGKMRATDNGARVPLVIWGRGLVKQRGVTEELCELADLFPTLADYAEAPLPEGQPCDGKSLKPFLSGESDTHRQWIFSYIGSARMIRDKRYLVEAADPVFGDARGRFYDCGANRSGFGYRRIQSPSGEAKVAENRLYELLDELPQLDFSTEPAKSITEKYRAHGKHRHQLTN